VSVVVTLPCLVDAETGNRTFGIKELWCNLRHHTGIYMERLRNTMKYFTWYKCPAGGDLKLGNLEYGAESFPSRKTCDDQRGVLSES
jgi:hypothetical protein